MLTACSTGQGFTVIKKIIKNRVQLYKLTARGLLKKILKSNIFLFKKYGER